MKLTKQQRTDLKMKFGGHCAYCGCELGDKWHADHIEAVKRDFDMKKCPKTGYMIPVANGVLFKPENDNLKNMNPACVPCNTNKSSMGLESWRRSIAHYRDVQLLRDSTHARHLHRFGLIVIKPDPVVFFFETWSEGVSSIQKVGGIGMAEIILSEALTGAVLPNCYFHDIKLYGHVSDHDDVAYVFCEDTKQYLAYKPAKDACGEYVLLVDLKAELAEVSV